MYCKRRTKQRVAQNGSVGIIQSSRLLKHRSILPAIITLVLLLAGSIQLSRAAFPPAQFEPVQTDDMTRNDFAAFNSPFDCTTAGCHQQLAKTKWVHAPVATNACTQCHESISPLNEHQFIPAPADASACNSCHTFDSAPVSTHEPFQLGTCNDCHDPHGGDRKNYIKAESIKALCLDCHDQTEASFLHHPAAIGDCQACHNPHQSKHKMLLSQSKETLCLGCHQSLDHSDRLGAFSLSTPPVSTHEPVAQESCLTCHLAHGSDQRGILAQSQRSLCIRCHDDLDENLPLAQSVHSPYTEDQSCTKCHSPHDSEHESLLVASQGYLCMTCHDQPIILSDDSQIPDMKKLIEESAVVHEPAALGQCTSCHRPHFSTQHNLLQVGYPEKDYVRFEIDNYAMCIQCHDQIMIEEETSTLTGFRDGGQNLHFVHINREKGRSCSICHQPHAGSLPSLMRESFPFGPGGWDLPIGFTPTATGGSCISACHEQRTYDNTTSGSD